jgi:glycosyltransferase involved in cell wall biosynthesis
VVRAAYAAAAARDRAGAVALRIGIDAHSIGMGAGGNETHYENLVRWIPKLDTQSEYVLYFSHLDAERMQRYAVNGRVTAETLPWKSSYLRVPLALPQAIRRDALDVFHAQYVLPPFTRCKTLLTVCDLAFEHHPETFRAIEAARCKLMIPRSARKADHIVTLSEFSKRDISERYGIPPEKITVTYCGPDENFAPVDRSQAREELARTYNIAGEFLLYVGRIQARKNLVRLVEALAALKKRGATHKLVIVGKQDFQAEQLVAKVAELGLEQDVIFTGYVPTEDLPKFYSAAEAFVFPSIFEGFGLPVIEAMACGAAVVTSLGSSLEEVAGDAALLADPHSTDSITSAIDRVLGDDAWRAELRRRGIQRAKRFSYRDAAAQTIKLYMELAAT